jgi:hypothetical protein
MASDICWSLLWYLLHVTLLAFRVFRRLPGFWKNLCSPDADEGCLRMMCSKEYLDWRASNGRLKRRIHDEEHRVKNGGFL